MEEKRFNPKKLDKLNNPIRLKEIPPELIIKESSMENPEVIIDLGAGTGFFSIPFAEKFKNCTIYACDISEIMVDWMNENISPKYNNIIPMKMEDNDIALENEIADYLIMINLHHELDSTKELLLECNRLLKPKAKLIISDWKKEKSERGPSFEIRHETETIKQELLEYGFHNIKINTNLENHFLIVAEKK